MKTTLKKTLSIILTILMIVTAMPFAFAVGDGVPLTIDVTDKSSVIIGNGSDYFDEDGYIITGTNTEAPIYIYDSCHITFNNMSASDVYIISDTEENVTVTLDGDNYMYGGFNIYDSNLTINGDDDDILKIVSSASAFTTGGANPGSLTVNGGKINAVTETTDNYPTVSCFAGFTLNGGEVTASNNYYYVISNKTIINGGTLNVISTSPDIEAIDFDVEIAKGALLTVNATYMVIRSIYNIIAVNEGEENLLLFARFDKDSDFAPVLDIKAALDGKAYAEIKVDTHEHSLENGKCVCGYECPHENITDGKCGVCGYECPHESITDGKCDACGYECPHESYTDGKCGVCGYECPHESITDGKCDACGVVGTVIAITMNDSYGDGWNGNSIVIKQLVDGAYTEVASATFYDGDSDTFTKLLPAEYIYALSWDAADYADECSFTVAVDGKTVYECADGSALSVGKVFYVMCEHNIENGSCSECGLTCGVDFEHTLTDYACTVCGKYMYAITHQPTSVEPYVEINNDTDASYQWCTVEGSTVEITDENARPFDPSEVGIPDELFSGTVTYDAEVGWSPMMLSDAGWLLYFVADLKAGEVVSVEFSSEFPMVVSLVGVTMDEEVYFTVDGNRAGGVVEIDGVYALKVACDIDALTSLPMVKAYFDSKVYTPVEGAAAAELADPVIGNEYACEVTFADGTKEMSDSFEYTYTITHQPTSDEPYVELNDDTDASYQWYTVEGGAEITDENAKTSTGTYSAEYGWSPMIEASSSTQYYFSIDLKAGDKVSFEFSSVPEMIVFSDFIVRPEETTYSYVADLDRTYELLAYYDGTEITARAYLGDVTYTAIDGETSAELKNAEIGKRYACEVTFADGTTEMSDTFEVTKLHDCDFSGEWKYDADKHWKECAVDGCSKISEEAGHTYTDGKCACGYVCPHEKYTDGVCDKCGYECPHEWGEGVLTRPTFETDGYYTYTCTLCGHSYTEPTEKADTTALNDASVKVTEYIDNDTLTQEAANEIHNSYLDILKNNGNVFDEFGFVRGDLVEEDQPAINAITEELQKIIDEAEEKIASGEYVKADYSEIDEAIKALDEKIADENVTDEGKAELEEIKKQLEEMKADENTSAADVAELEKALEDYEEELDKGIEDGTLVKVDGIAIINELNSELTEKLIDDHGKNALEEFYAGLSEEAYKSFEDRVAALFELAASLTGSVKENEEKIAELKAEIHEMYTELDNCLNGTHNGLEYTVTEEAKCGVNAIESATCTLCGETDEREVEGSALEHSFTKYEVTEEAECGKAGKEVASCDHGCGATDEKEIPALEHADKDGDLKCDHGCGHEFPKPVEPEQPDTPDEPEQPEEDGTICEYCGSNHNNPITRIFCRITQFFIRLFTFLGFWE